MRSLGTSTRNNGQKGSTPLVPSWLLDQEKTQGESGTSQDITNQSIEVLQNGNPRRFTTPRKNFTRYVKSEGRDGESLHRALSGYVRHSVGGTHNAVTRLGAARSTTANLFYILGQTVEKNWNVQVDNRPLGLLTGMTVEKAIGSLIDILCPDGGTEDESIARNALAATVDDIPELQKIPLGKINEAILTLIVKNYMAHVIMLRILNDIGNKIIQLPKDNNTIGIIATQLEDLLKGAVSDSFNEELKDRNLTEFGSVELKRITDCIYERTFEVLMRLGGTDE